MTGPRRIALFGGSFDPVHEGHIEVAKTAVEALNLDEVRFIPCRISPHKQEAPPASPEARLEMLSLAVANLPWASIDDTELKEPPPSYSYKTAARIQQEEPDAQLFWLLGTDQWESLPCWKFPEKLAEMLEFIVFRRGPLPKPRDGWRMKSIEGHHPASSSAIRRAVKDGEIPLEWLNPDVWRFIEKESLYRD